MGISYLTPIPVKNEKTFSFRTTKQVLIFTADKPKENLKEKENIKNCLTDVKKKNYSDIPYILKENILTDIKDYGKNKPLNIDYLNFFHNGKYLI
jgi:hypothetical protein